MAFADPATVPGATTISALGVFSGTVPDGVCFVQASVLGGAGGKAQAFSNSNGAGASITATVPVIAGQTYSGAVGGGGGQVETPGDNGGGHGGDTDSGVHPGAGGGGYSEFLVDSTLAILAGGGGGSSGGHTTTTEGFGGDAGLPGFAGEIASGAAGTDGLDSPTSIIVGAGTGGTATAPGSGGVHSTNADRSGTAGTGRTGGSGGHDIDADTGGGGGGGYFGGGGGASTNDQGAANHISGGGGGGGSSFVSSDAADIISVAGPKGASNAMGDGASGSVSLTWIGCDYDLAVAKSVSAASTTIGDTITWTVTVTNVGTDAMTRGDIVTLTDSLPGSGAKTITAISVSGGANADLERGAIECGATVGDPMPSTLECSRDFQIVGDTVSGERGLDVGETLTVVYQQTAAGSVGAVLNNEATVTDRVTGDTNDTTTVTTTLVADPPVAENDSDLGNELGTTVDVPVTGNDGGTVVASSVTLWDPISHAAITSPYAVAGEGTWTVEAGGVIRFTPEPGFQGDPTPVTYQITDSNNLTDTATVTVTYVPEAADDSSLGNTLGTTVVVDVLTNDTGDFDPSTVRIVDPNNSLPVTTLVVDGEGTWSVDLTTGAITFAPETGFTGNPTAIAYSVTDTTGDTVSANAVVSYLPEATDDSSAGNEQGAAVTVDVIGNDTGIFDPTSVVIIDPANGDPVTELIVDGEGTWNVDAVTGAITFTPLKSFTGDPSSVSYEVTDTSGNVTTAQVHIRYLHPAAPAGGLAFTGVDTALPMGVAGVLLLGGLMLLFVRFRRARAMVG